jgi:hypothetical protein
LSAASGWARQSRRLIPWSVAGDTRRRVETSLVIYE